MTASTLVLEEQDKDTLKYVNKQKMKLVRDLNIFTQNQTFADLNDDKSVPNEGNNVVGGADGDLR